jgi:hypothetical protein
LCWNYQGWSWCSVALLEMVRNNKLLKKITKSTTMLVSK